MKATRAGILASLAASVCCVGPLVLIGLGLGSLGLGAWIGRFHWGFIGAAGVLLVFGWWIYLKESRRCQAAQCQMEKRNATRIVLGAATLVVLFFAALNIYTYVAKPSVSAANPGRAAAETAEVVLPVEGMTCFTCELTVEKSLTSAPGVVEAKASAKEGLTRVVYDPQQTSVPELVAAINRTGYKASRPRGKGE